MHWLSESADELIALASGPMDEREVDVLVIGSGYGGAVAALRFAQAGQRVFVLERGKEYVAGEFPNDLSQTGAHVRAETATAEGVATAGDDSALFDLRLGLRAGALVGNGLGGGSLINAAVGLRPDDRVFRQEDWPAALRQEDLSPWFDQAEKMLEVRKAGPSNASGQAAAREFDIRATPKYMRFHELAREAAAAADASPAGDRMDVSFDDAPLAIQLDGAPSQALGPRSNCIGCGDCVTGCNHNAKLSLPKTYLPAARKAGARFFTGVTVLAVQADEAASRDFPWRVSFVRTAERKLRQDIAAQGNEAHDGWTFRLRAAKVVLAAGTFGSTEILLRSRAMGLSVSSTALGVGVSGNGDDVSFAYNLKDDARAVGWGSAPKPLAPVGPTISAVLKFSDPRDLKRGTIAQDGSAPGLMSGMVHELLTTLGTIAQLDRWRYDRRDGGDPLALKPAAMRRSMVLLGMGHDSAGGVIAYDPHADRIGWGWPDAGDEQAPSLHRERLKAVEELGGTHLQNPAVSVLPESVKQMLTGPAIGGALFTVHPLGGCRMGDTAIDGVVNHWGQVFRADGGLHEGLFVMDGSIMPGSLGANPMLTITALAERACAKILLSVHRQPAKNLELPDSPVVAPLEIAQALRASATLGEVLRGPVTVQRDIGPFKASAEAPHEIAAALFVRFEVADWQALYDDPSHRAVVPASLDADDYGAPRLVLQDTKGHSMVLHVEKGEVQVFRRVEDGWLRHAERFVRAALTYTLNRWLPDYIKDKRRGRGSRPLGQWAAWLVSALKALGHATEVRVFEYNLTLTSAEAGAWYTLHGVKRIEAAASWASLKEWFSHWLHGDWPAPRRTSLWDQLTQADIELRQGEDLVLAGRVAMDVNDGLRNLTPQLGTARDTLHALHGLAGYPMLLLRAAIKGRLLDFRAPDLREPLPEVDPALIAKPKNYFELDQPENRFPPIPTKQGLVAPEAPMFLDVRSSHRSKPDETVRIGLVRYKQPEVQWVQDAVSGQAKAKSIVLMNGFAQSTRAFVAPELEAEGGCLASTLYDAGWDVWLLEYRVSPLLDASARYATMDDIAAFDIPAAVDRVARKVSEESRRDPALTQVFAFSHCVGSASLAMSILGGWLRAPTPAAWPGNAHEPNRLAGVLFSQFLPFVVGSETAQQRLQLASFLRNVLKREMLDFTAGAAQPDLLHSLLDRVFATLPYPDAEKCPHEHDMRELQPDSTTCKRMSGLLSRLFKHEQLLHATHEKLDWYFGRTNLGVFLHGAKCVEHERLVNAEGQNAYVTDRNLAARLNMPVMLLQGADNVLFDKESLSRSAEQLNRVFGGYAGRPGSPLHKTTTLLVADHAHFDCTIGKLAPKVVFPDVLDFFGKALAGSPLHPPFQTRCRARLPRTGPIAGWVRPGSAPGASRARVWIQLETTSSDAPVAAITDVSYQVGNTAHRDIGAWARWRQELTAGDAQDLQMPEAMPYNGLSGRRVWVYYAVADVDIPADATGVSIRMFGVHLYRTPLGRPQGSAQPPSPPPGFPQDWGTPMSDGDLETYLEPLSSPAAIAAANDAPSGAIGWVPFSLQPPSFTASQGPDSELEQAAGNAKAFGRFGTHQTDLFLQQAPDEGPVVTEDLGNAVPLGYALTPAMADLLLEPLRQTVLKEETLARRADPGTLSRQKRRIRSMRECELRLAPAQLWDSGRLEFIAGACRYPGLTGFEQERAGRVLHELADAPESGSSAFMLMLGDQIYADARAGLFDTASIIERLVPRYEAAFGSSGFRAVASKVPLYMVADDHEISDGWTAEYEQAGPEQAGLAENAYATFRSFQRAHGPDVGARAQGDENNYPLQRAGVGFFVLDTRFQRRMRPEPQMLKATIWRRLARWLKAQQALGDQPKFVISGSVFAPGLIAGQAGGRPVRGTDTWQDFPRERQMLLSFIARHEIANVVFLSSDYHCSAVAQLSWDGSGPKAWAIVAPPLHAPLRFANTEAHELLAREDIRLKTGGNATVELCRSWDGEGWLHFAVERATQESQAGWRTDLQYRLRQLDSGAVLPAAGTRHTIFMPDRSPPRPPAAAASAAPVASGGPAPAAGTVPLPMP